MSESRTMSLDYQLNKPGVFSFIASSVLLGQFKIYKQWAAISKKGSFDAKDDLILMAL